MQTGREQRFGQIKEQVLVFFPRFNHSGEHRDIVPVNNIFISFQHVEVRHNYAQHAVGAFLDHCNIDPAIGIHDWRDCAADLHGPKHPCNGLIEIGKQKQAFGGHDETPERARNGIADGFLLNLRGGGRGTVRSDR